MNERTTTLHAVIAAMDVEYNKDERCDYRRINDLIERAAELVAIQISEDKLRELGEQFLLDNPLEPPEGPPEDEHRRMTVSKDLLKARMEAAERVIFAYEDRDHKILAKPDAEANLQETRLAWAEARRLYAEALLDRDQPDYQVITREVVTSGTESQTVTAYAEPADGPGWSNTPIWIITRDGDQRLHQECLQPEDQTKEMRLLYAISAAVQGTLTRLVQEQRQKLMQERGYV